MLDWIVNRGKEKQMYPEMKYAREAKKQPKYCKHGCMNIPNLHNDSSI